MTDARKGNQFWKARSRHGRKPIFDDPEKLWESCCDYFEWTEQNPLYEDKVAFFQGVATHEKVAKMRAMTITGLCIFLDITTATWHEIRTGKGAYAAKKNDFSIVCTRAEEIIRTQKFTGAAADLLNPLIIARDLGLADKKEDKVTMDADSLLKKISECLPN